MLTIKQVYATFFGGIILLILLLVATTSWYTVDESEQAAVHTFGKVTEQITQPGLHFKMPWPIQYVTKVSKETFSLTFGYEENGNGQTIEKTEEAKMLTGDENIVLADLVVQWRIGDVEKFLYKSNNPEQVLYNATSAALRGVIGSSKIDSALTDGKPEIERSVKDQLRKLIDRYDIGITIMDVKLQDVDLPNEEVRKAFTEVTDAREQKNTKVNEALKYKNEKYNEAQGTAAARLSIAQGTKIERIERAKGDVARFEALYQEYVNNPNITRERLVIETLEKVLPGAEIYIMDDSSETVKYLPIRPLQGGNQ
ncbi:FtsH protease activity modulator HflK [Microaerobacter geothermalis]|uniref:FtsH protease activity modulator HflK n=1 Tax=Microaerobacter geothermalis TaxID=674972 RepID=UPI001F2F1D42|nr:FtsH protease activity modulator HflK [Microaerobacter geothermalis]MCF6092966.1 FtsH protease activity modulator HflK [Microaerobacter geothermalis]